MWFASVEGDSGERLNVLDDRGNHGGKPLLAFLLGLFAYCSELKEGRHPRIIYEWYVQLEALAQEPLCPLAEPLEQAMCSLEDIDTFHEDEYAFYLYRHPHLPLTEAQFKQQRREFMDKPVEIELLRTSLQKLIDILKRTQIEADEDDAWYSPIDTLPDLIGLDQALGLLAQRRAEKALIRII